MYVACFTSGGDPKVVFGKCVQIMERALSDAEYLRFEGLLDKRAAHGNLDLVCECIDVTLGRFTSQSMQDSYNSGKAFIAPGTRNDTIKPVGSGGGGNERLTVDQRIANGESPPGPCPFPGCNESHWLKHCGKRIAKEKADRAKAQESQGQEGCKVCQEDSC